MFEQTTHNLDLTCHDFLETGYQQKIYDNDEKFRIWRSKSFFERKRAFGKIIMFDGLNTDKLSALIAEEMELLLTKSELA